MTKNSQLVEQYQYDANGNRTLATSIERGVSGVSASYNLGDQLQGFGNTSYTYDGNGRLSQKTTGTDVTTYDYDSQGRLKQVQTPDHTIEYRHNALGNRVAKVKDGQVVERYLWQDKTTLLATYYGDGNLKQRFNYTLGHAPTSFTENGETYYLLTDHLGSPRMITDSAGQVVKAIEYDAYGNVISDSNPGFEIPFGFAGGLKDPDTGLIRFGYRDYDPTTGRWTARDPIGFDGGDTNLYGYVSNDPVNFVDPTGEIAWAVVGAIVGAGGELAWQMIVEGKSLGCVDVTKVAAAATMGALGGWASGINKLNKVSKTVTPNAAQQKNIDRFQKKIPANAKEALNKSPKSAIIRPSSIA
ncbi:RHS repeat-associated protein [Marinobacter sp. MBR-99]